MIFNTQNESKDHLFEKLYLYFFIILPFIYVDKLVDPVLLPRQLFLTFFVFITSLIIVIQIRKKRMIADFSFLKLLFFIFFIGLLLAITVSFFQSIVVQESIYLLSKVAIEFVFCMTTTYLLIQGKLSVESLIKSVIVFCSIALSMGLYQLVKLGLSDKIFFEEVPYISATFGVKNLLASVLFLTFPFLLNTFKFKNIWKIASVSVGFLSICVIWLLQTKAVIIALFGFIILLMFFSFVHRRKTTKKSILKLFTISCILIVLIMSAITIQNRQKFSHLFDKKSSVERLFIWDNSVQMMKEHFVLGVGAGNWQIHVPKYGLDNCPTPEIKAGIRTLQRPHNDFLWVLCEMGVGGFIAYISAFILILYYAFKLFLKFKDQTSGWLFLSLFASVIGYGMIAFVDFPFERIEHQVLLLIIFSIIAAYYYMNFGKSKGPVIILKNSTITFLFIVPIVLSIIVATQRSVGEFHSRKIYTNESKANWPLMINEANRALNTFYVMDPMSAPIQWYKGVALFSLGKIDDAKISFEQAYAIHPYNIHVLNNLGSCYESLNDHSKAIEYYSKALAISSEFDEVRLNLSAVYFNMKEFEKAFNTIDRCNVECKDQKYKLFLPTILSSWLEIKLKKEDYSKDKISNLLSDKDKIVQLYFESKVKKIKFDIYVLNSIN